MKTTIRTLVAALAAVLFTSAAAQASSVFNVTSDDDFAGLAIAEVDFGYDAGNQQLVVGLTNKSKTNAKITGFGFNAPDAVKSIAWGTPQNEGWNLFGPVTDSSSSEADDKKKGKGKGKAKGASPRSNKNAKGKKDSGVHAPGNFKFDFGFGTGPKLTGGNTNAYSLDIDESLTFHIDLTGKGLGGLTTDDFLSDLSYNADKTLSGPFGVRFQALGDNEEGSTFATVVVPSPSAAMAGLLGLGCVALRRRSR